MQNSCTTIYTKGQLKARQFCRPGSIPEPKARSFFGALFFTKKKRFSAKIRFRRIFAQITFAQYFNCVNCAGEAVKCDIIPTRPTKAAPRSRKKQLKYDSHHSAPQSDFCIPQPPQRTPFIPNMTATTAHQHYAPRCTTHLHHAQQRTRYSSHI